MSDYWRTARVSARDSSTSVRKSPRRHPYCSQAQGDSRGQAMITEDQTAVIAFLAAPSTHGGSNVERIDTHASVVFLAGTRAYKLKRAVRFDYLDFSTPERRRALCEAEVRLNRRTAPALYRGVVAVTRRADGSYRARGRRHAGGLARRDEPLSAGGAVRPAGIRGRPSPRSDAAAGRGHCRSSTCRPRIAPIMAAGRGWVGDRRQRGRVRGVRTNVPGPVRVVPCHRRCRSRARIGVQRFSNGVASRVSCGSVTATFTCATSFCWTGGRHSSTASSSTTRFPAPTSCTISRSS